MEVRVFSFVEMLAVLRVSAFNLVEGRGLASKNRIWLAL